MNIFDCKPDRDVSIILPSPNMGKTLIINACSCAKAKDIYVKIWKGLAAIEDFPEVTEVDMKEMRLSE